MSAPSRDDGAALKTVMAVVRPERLTEVKGSLAAADVRGFTVTNVSGRGSQPIERSQWRGVRRTVDLHQKVRIECVVTADRVEEAVAAIEEAAHTGHPGDGKIFVLPAEGARRIRTDDRDADAV